MINIDGSLPQPALTTGIQTGLPVGILRSIFLLCSEDGIRIRPGVGPNTELRTPVVLSVVSSYWREVVTSYPVPCSFLRFLIRRKIGLEGYDAHQSYKVVEMTGCRFARAGTALLTLLIQEGPEVLQETKPAIPFGGALDALSR